MLLPLPSAAATADGIRNLIRHSTPRPAQTAAFENSRGQSVTLEAFRGGFTLVNFWATWCAPCREEMPHLDRLQAQMKAEGLYVLAVAQERSAVERLQSFYNEQNLRNLAIYRDPFLRLGRAYGVTGLPVTILLNPKGEEIARLIGPADWASQEAVRALRELMRRP